MLSSSPPNTACGCRPYDASLLATCVSSGTCSAASCLGPAGAASCTLWKAPTACPSGYYNYGAGTGCSGSVCSLGTCVPCNCGPGSTVSVCDSLYTQTGGSNFACTACSNKPVHASYVTAHNNTCDYQCNSGYSGASCTACITSCQAGFNLTGACTQNVNGLGDTVPTCVACTVPHALTYSSGCTVSACRAGYALVNNACVAYSPPPKPPSPPPRPPPPPSPPPPVVNAESYPSCASQILGHWFGVTPVADATGARVADAINGNGAAVSGTFNTSSGSFYFNGNTSAATVKTEPVGANGMQMLLTFSVASNASSTLLSVADNIKTPSNSLSLIYNTNQTLSIVTNTLAFGTQFFKTSVTYAPNTVFSVQLVCGPTLTGCFVL